MDKLFKQREEFRHCLILIKRKNINLQFEKK